MSTNSSQFNGYLKLDNGDIYEGYIFGYRGNDNPLYQRNESAELVFQTGMVGYPESITDPSYYGQIMVFTYPLVGNYGFPKKEINQFGIDDSIESDSTFLRGIVVREYVDKYNHYAADKSLNNWMIEHKLIGISGIDTRKLTKYITESGFCQAWIIPEPYHKILHKNIDNQLYVSTLFEKDLAYKAYNKEIKSYNIINLESINNFNINSNSNTEST
jgi:carbamoyl-phosphate synthase small subunit